MGGLVHVCPDIYIVELKDKTDWDFTVHKRTFNVEMNGRKRSLCNPPSYSLSGARFDVATRIYISLNQIQTISKLCLKPNTISYDGGNIEINCRSKYLQRHC